MDSGGTPSIFSLGEWGKRPGMLPSPIFRIVGTWSPPAAAARWARVEAPASPYSAASGALPMPTESRTIRTAFIFGLLSFPRQARMVYCSDLLLESKNPVGVTGFSLR